MYCRGRGSPILTPDDRDALPPAYRLDAAVHNLQDKGNHRALIGLVEAWWAVDEPSPAARLAQARAFVRLGLVDRAWARIQGLVDAEGATAEAHALTAELFLTRQWPKRARDVLNRGLASHPDDHRLKALWDRMAEPRTTPDLEAVEDENADVPSLIAASHHLIASGAHTRARALLERAHRIDAENTLVADMLWALEGDFEIEGTLSELARRFGPDLSELADLDDEPEHTESTEIGSLGDDRDKQGSFPSLFRDLEPRTEMLGGHHFDEQSDEITKVTSMMDIGGMDTLTDQTFTGEHTEIQRVITRKTLTEAGVDKGKKGGAAVEDVESETAFDLAGLQSDLTAPEFEDDDVVVMTRKEEERTDTAPGADTVVEEKIVLDSEPPPAAGRRQSDEAETWVLPPEDERRPKVEKAEPKGSAKKTPDPKRSGTPRPPPVPDDDDDLLAPSGPGNSLWLVVFAGVFALSIAAALLLIGLGLVTG